jgi:hypothetical protein
MGLDIAKQKINLWRADPHSYYKAESSWLAAPFLGDPILDGVTIVHLVRHPWDVIRSSIFKFGDHPTKNPYFQWMKPYLPGIEKYDDKVEILAYWYIGVNKLIEPHATFRHRVEDGYGPFMEKLGLEYDGKYTETTYNTAGGSWEIGLDLTTISPFLQGHLRDMGYGYEELNNG